jgi:hypothetical protein
MLARPTGRQLAVGGKDSAYEGLAGGGAVPELQ